MKYFCCLGIICSLNFSVGWCFFQFHRNANLECCADKPENPLILTPFIEQGKIKEARVAAQVNLGEFKDVRSYAAYLRVNDFHDSNLFFWFFPAKTDYEKAPVVLWLQGGPGVSSIFGLFTENGPFEILPDGDLQLRKYSWTNKHSVIYIDNPVGTGFSYTDEGGYVQNQTAVAAGLYSALLQFFQVFPELQKNRFYVAGESYAGKYVPAISYAIHKNNPSTKQTINLQGLAIGNGLCDPDNQQDYGDYLYQIGLVDSNTKGINEIGPKINIYNYLSLSNEFDLKTVSNYLQREVIKSALHVDNATFDAFSGKVHSYLWEDIGRSVTPWISELLDHYRILFYNGQLDIILAYPLTVNFLKHLNFSAANEYKTAPRHQWYVGKELAGYVKQAGNLTEVLVRNAGHMVPTNQPLWAQDLITRFTHNEPLYG